jgi:hypothetical protein
MGIAGVGGAAGVGGTTGAGGSGGAAGNACVPTTTELLGNPDFDSTPLVWTEVSLFPSGVIIAEPPVEAPPQTAPNVAWEGGYMSAQDDIYQDVMIPANATSITFSFYYLVRTEETGATAFDQMAAYVFDPDTSSGTPVLQLSNLDAGQDWTKFSAQIPLTWAGRVAEFGFTDQTDNVNLTNFFIDTASVTVTTCATAGAAN